MSIISTNDVQKIAELSKLDLHDNQLPVIAQRLENIMSLVKKMDKADTSQVEPLAHPFDAAQPLRADVVTEKNQRDLFQKNAPRVEAGLYIVPKFVDEA